MNLKKLQLERLRWEKPVVIKEIRIFRKMRNGHAIYPVKWCIEFKPNPPKGALTWLIEGDEFVLNCHHPNLMLGHIRMVPGLGGMRRSIHSLMRRRIKR